MKKYLNKNLKSKINYKIFYSVKLNNGWIESNKAVKKTIKAISLKKRG